MSTAERITEPWNKGKVNHGFVKKVQQFIEKPHYMNLALLALIIGVVLMISFKLYTNQSETMWQGIAVELHGVVFDVIILGILFGYFDRVREKNNRISRSLEEIEDNRQWKNQEAGFKAVGNIRRLNILGIFSFDLNEYFLSKANLKNLKMYDSYLSKVNMTRSRIIHTTMIRTSMIDSQAKGILIQESNLSGLYASNCNFREAKFINSSLEDSCITSSNFNGAYLMKVNMRGSILIGSSFEDAILEKVDFTNCRGLTAEMLLEASRVEDCTLDIEIMLSYEILKSAKNSTPETRQLTIKLDLVQEG